MKTLKKCSKSGLALAFFLLSFLQTQAQESPVLHTTPRVAISSNLLYDATTSMNLGMEFRLSDRFTFKLPVTYNPWTFDDNKKFKHLLVQPEIRWWFCESFSGHYLGLHGHYAIFNVGGIGSTKTMRDFRREGDLWGAGLSYGYQFYLSSRWNLELSLGLGYARLDYDKYQCETCGDYVGSEKKDYIGPTQAGISLIYIIK